MSDPSFRVAMVSLHSSPFGELGTRNTGGMSVYVRELAWELGRRGHRVDLFTRRVAPGEPGVSAMALGVRLVRLEGGIDGDDGKLGLYPCLPQYLRALEAFRAGEGLRYDLVHSHYWLSGCLGASAAAQWGVPHALMFHTLGAAKNRAGCGEAEPEVRVAREAALARESDLVVAPTAREREYLVGSCGAPAGRVAVIPCGVDLEGFRPRNRGACRRALGVSSEAAVVLCVGRFAPVKGPGRLLEAVSYLAPRRGRRVFLVGGDGPASPAEAAMRARARELGIGEETCFPGRVDQRDLPVYYGAADVVVVPSHYESFGLVGLEALACGTPVVAGPVGVLTDLLNLRINGVLVSDPGPEALARGIDAALDRAAAGSWSQEAIRATVSGYTWSRVADAVLAEYRRLLGPRSEAGHAGPAVSGGAG